MSTSTVLYGKINGKWNTFWWVNSDNNNKIMSLLYNERYKMKIYIPRTIIKYSSAISTYDDSIHEVLSTRIHPKSEFIKSIDKNLERKDLSDKERRYLIRLRKHALFDK